MNKYIKSIIIFSSLLICSSQLISAFCLFCSGGGTVYVQHAEPAYTTWAKVTNPYGWQIYEDTKTNVNVLSLNSQTTAFWTINEGQDLFETINNGPVACRYGGSYTLTTNLRTGVTTKKMKVYNKVSMFLILIICFSQIIFAGGGSKTTTVHIYYKTAYNQNSNPYYCKTTKDLFNEIQIPTSWENSNLLLHCNDGLYGGEDNYESILSRGHYKSCIVKNLDKKEENTVFFAFDIGNSVIEPTRKIEDNPILEKSNLQEESVLINSTNFYSQTFSNKKYPIEFFYYKYNETFGATSFVNTVSNVISLNTVFTYPTTESLSRIATFRKIENSSYNKFIYGTEKPYRKVFSQTSGISDYLTVYKIEFENIDFSQDMCIDTLSHYGSISTNFEKNKLILCFDNKIIINPAWAGSIEAQKKKAYEIYLDIIENLEFS